MNKFIIKFFILFFILINNTIAEENIMILKLKDGDIKIELFDKVAPNHVKRIKQLAQEGKYDGVVFTGLLMVSWLKQGMLSLATL